MDKLTWRGRERHGCWCRVSAFPGPCCPCCCVSKVTLYVHVLHSYHLWRCSFESISVRLLFAQVTPFKPPQRHGARSCCTVRAQPQ